LFKKTDNHILFLFQIFFPPNQDEQRTIWNEAGSGKMEAGSLKGVEV
jgi:hypothetical protein